MRERPLSALGERFAGCRPEYVLRERSCPGCGTTFAVDVQASGDPPLEGARLRGGSFCAARADVDATLRAEGPIN